MKTSVDFLQEHKGHELSLGNGLFVGPLIEGIDSKKHGDTATARCMKCGVSEEVLVCTRLLPDIPETDYVLVKCNYQITEPEELLLNNMSEPGPCNNIGYTSNTSPIGSRPIHLPCRHGAWFLQAQRPASNEEVISFVAELEAQRGKLYEIEALRETNALAWEAIQGADNVCSMWDTRAKMFVIRVVVSDKEVSRNIPPEIGGTPVVVVLI